MFKVIKRDGSIQDFDKSKVMDGILKSGASMEVAEAVALDVEAVFSDKTDEDKVSYLDIKAEVVNSLESKDPDCVQKYASYQK